MFSHHISGKSLLTISAIAAIVLLGGANPAHACGMCGDSYHYSMDPSLTIVGPGGSGGGSLASSDFGLFNIEINAQPSLASNAAALAAFNRAATRWESFLGDPITINITADLTTEGFSSPNILGQAGTARAIIDYDDLRNAMVLDTVGESAQNNLVINALPTNFTAILPPNFSLATSFNDPTQADMAVNTSVLKALGFTGFGSNADGIITFNSAFAFDYDNSDGVTAGQFDFESIALHEIGHVLGFISSVDDVAFFLERGQTAQIQATSWDLFRFENNTANDPSTLPQFTANARFLSTGGDAIFDDTTNEYRLSTGVNDGGTRSDGSGDDLTPVALRGDGRQASHWKDNDLTGTTIGIMDPTFGSGQTLGISEADLKVLDLIGYEVSFQPVPAPPAVVSLGIGGLVGLFGFGTRKLRARTRRAKSK